MNILRCISLTALVACTCAPACAQGDTTTRNWELRGYVKNMQTLSWAGPQKRSQTDGFIHNRLIFKYKPDSNWTIDAELRNRLFYGEGSRTGGAYYANLLDKVANHQLPPARATVNGLGHPAHLATSNDQ